MKGETMNWQERIHTDPMISHGQACIKGTRIPVAVVLDNLAAARSYVEILTSYPSLTQADIQAAIAYAAEIARERLVPTPIGR